MLIKPLTTKAYDRRASGDCGTSGCKAFDLLVVFLCQDHQFAVANGLIYIMTCILITTNYEFNLTLKIRTFSNLTEFMMIFLIRVFYIIEMKAFLRINEYTYSITDCEKKICIKDLNIILQTFMILLRNNFYSQNARGSVISTPSWLWRRNLLS